MKINSLLIASIFLSALFMADSIAQNRDRVAAEFPDVKKADDKSPRLDSVKCKNHNKEKNALKFKIIQACAAAGDIDSCIKIKQINYPNYFGPGRMDGYCDGMSNAEILEDIEMRERIAVKLGIKKYVSPAIDPINSEPDAFKSYYGFDKPTDPEEIKRRLKL